MPVNQGPRLQVDAQLVALAEDAVDALAHLDGERLEALLRSCRCRSSEAVLNCIPSSEVISSLAFSFERRLAVLHRLLGLTRANQVVVERALQTGSRPLEYSSRICLTFGRG